MNNWLWDFLTRWDINTEDDLYEVLDSHKVAYAEVYAYYLNSGEMPYGIAKARTGDPDVWLEDRVLRDAPWLVGMDT